LYHYRSSGEYPATVNQSALRTAVSEGLSRKRIEQRFRRNSGLIIAARIVTACLSLGTIPVVVSRLGVAAFGTWEALVALASLASMFQAAISGTLVWRISEAYGRGDAAEIRRVARIGAGAVWAVFLLVWPLAWVLREPAVRFLGISADTQQLAAQMFPVVAALILLSGLSETLEAVVSGCQRTGLVNVVGAAAHTLNYTAVIVMVLLGGGLWSLVAGQTIAFFVRFAGATLASRASYGAVSLVPVLPRRTDLSMARYSGLLMVGSVAAALRDQTDKVVLASLASPTWVGYYGMAVRLSALVMEIIRFFYLPIVTAVGAMNAMGDWDGVRGLYRRLMAVVSVVTGLIVVLVLGLADYLIVLWIGRPIPEVTPLLWWLMAGSASAAMLTGPGTAICRGCGRAAIETVYLAVNLVLNLALTVSLVLLIGPIGTAVATGATWAVSSILFLVVLHRRVDLPLGASRRAAATALLAAMVAGVLYWTSGMLGLPHTRPDALWYCALLGTIGGVGYFGVLVVFRVVSVNGAIAGLRALVRSA
jgi:O-antigen/teichoic acid export membrane protein